MQDISAFESLPTYEEVCSRFWAHVSPGHLKYIGEKLSEACYLAQERCEIDWGRLGDGTPEKIHKGNDFALERNKLIIQLLQKMGEEFDDVTTEIRLPDSGPRTYLAIYIGKVLLTTKSKRTDKILPDKSNYIENFSRLNTYIPQQPIPGMADVLGLERLIASTKEKEFDLYGVICYESNYKRLLTGSWIKFPDYGYNKPIGNGINLQPYSSTTTIEVGSSSTVSAGAPKDLPKKGVRRKKLQEEDPNVGGDSVEEAGG